MTWDGPWTGFRWTREKGTEMLPSGAWGLQVEESDRSPSFWAG